MTTSSPRAVVQRHRTLWISDMHLGSPGCRAKALVEFLAQNECEQLYLVGDIIDGWKLQKRFYWTADHTRVIKALLRKARRGTQIFYLTGNHDAFMRQFVKKTLRLGRIRIQHELVHLTADGRRLLVQHGDQFDAVVRSLPGLARAGDFAYESLLKVSARLSPVAQRLGLGADVSLSAVAKYWVKSVVQHLSGFDDAVYYMCRRDGLQGVVCGHTHHAEVRHIRNGIVSYNCGDWVESCTALAEDARGQLRIVRGRPSAIGAPTGARRASVPTTPAMVVRDAVAPAPKRRKPPQRAGSTVAVSTSASVNL